MFATRNRTDLSAGSPFPSRFLRKRGGLLLLAGLLTALLSLPALAEGGGSGGGSGEMDRMVPIEAMPITIIHQARVRGILLVEFYVEAPSTAEAERVYYLMPKLKDAWRTGLNEFANHEVRMDKPVNLHRIDLYLSRETHKVLGNRGSHIVFRQVMMQRR